MLSDHTFSDRPSKFARILIVIAYIVYKYNNILQQIIIS